MSVSVCCAAFVCVCVYVGVVCSAVEAAAGWLACVVVVGMYVILEVMCTMLFS